MKKLHDHIISGLNEKIEINVIDEKGPGGANHLYSIKYGENILEIKFQKGPLKENPINGISQETLLAIVIDRLRGFQEGEFSCRENSIALTKCEEALMWLKKRTNDRIIRGVEGFNIR